VPLPRVVLVVAASLAAAAPDAARERPFVVDAPSDLAHYLLAELEAAHGASLPPPGTSLAILATALKLWLSSLPDPLLTGRCLPAFIGAGVAGAPPRAAAAARDELPAAPRATLALVVEAMARLAAAGGPTPADMAAAVTPCVAWWPGAGGGGLDPGAAAPPARADLTPQEAVAVARALEVLILQAADRAGGGEGGGGAFGEPGSPLGFFGE